ncbi:molecular chaperone HtpG [Rickettsia endosymbiont of Cardiosporidium cionae]|uniref:molecular chaperone HtpG n=1 Tax=Rickettsia endosymbiont of Cardiosporidium cionae TaxID=2777155 RepID=UPI001893E07B|nr:molecular chaperone HtpG [Rickettsia endosymbiont of Cardiosporidium cionae]KAF8818854.1 molecular chaperone HtpG [Rickettsia endosymbiont of Cardiosporidium cionae]
MEIEKKKFNAEVDKVLHLMIHSLYTNKDIAIRELLSNSADACDKLRYLLQIDNTLQNEDSNFQIEISIDKDKKLLKIRDNGIGMNKEELENNLGTIAKSGTQDFLKSLSGDTNKDSLLIGQFGVGFYSAFMISDHIEVVSKKSGEGDSCYAWSSDGTGEYSISQSESDLVRGTEITLHIIKDQEKFLEYYHLKHVVESYSDHIFVPIFYKNEKNELTRINSSSALWSRSASDISNAQYKEFYNKLSHSQDEPWLILHNKNEGAISFINLLFIPTDQPFDMRSYTGEVKSRIKLYVKRVFITEDNIDIIPNYLNFVRGIIDSEDLPLNISRETLQHNAQITKIKYSITNRILSELRKIKENEPDKYLKFWNVFGSVLKIGLRAPHIDTTEVNKLLEISMFNSAMNKKLISIDDYIEHCKSSNPEQKNIYYLIGDNLDELYHSPQIEGFLSKNIDVLLLTDQIDNEWVLYPPEYKGFTVKSVTRSDIDLESSGDDKEEDTKDVTNSSYDNVIKHFKKILDKSVQDVVISKKLLNSPACISAIGPYDIKLESLLISQGAIKKAAPKILEINPNHAIIKKISCYIDENKNLESAEKLIYIIYDQACIVAGSPLQNPADFAKRLNNILEAF